MKTRIMAVVLGVLLFLSPSWVGAFEHCEADLNGDGEVGPADLAMLLASWGACPPPPSCCFPHGVPPGCEEPICESLVCDQDPFCCNTQWDDICAVAAAELCPECFGLDCCFVHGGGGCTDRACDEIVCAIVSDCCDFLWDQNCVVVAEAFCDQCSP